MASPIYLGRTIKLILTNSYRVHFRDIECAEEMIFPEEKFILPDCFDTEGNLHHFFKGYETTIPPMYVRSLKNALCHTSFEEAYTSGGQVVLEHTTQREVPVRWGRFLKNVMRVKGNVVLLRQIIEDNYYHWLIETLSGLYLIRKSGFKPNFYIVANKLSFQKQWLKLLGIKEEQIIEPNLFIQADELIVPDLINNWIPVEFRKHFAFYKYWLPTWGGKLYRETILPYVRRQPKRNIYISRQSASYRKVLNENELLPILEKYDYEVICCENLSVEKQIETFTNAQTIVGTHGAGLANAMFSDEGTHVMELSSQYYHDSSYRILLHQTGQRYHYMIGETPDISVPPQKENVYIDPGKFESALKMLTQVSSCQSLEQGLK